MTRDLQDLHMTSDVNIIEVVQNGELAATTHSWLTLCIDVIALTQLYLMLLLLSLNREVTTCISSD